MGGWNFGVAVVEPEPGDLVDEADVIAKVTRRRRKTRLAGDPAPRRALTTDMIGRSPNGEVDCTRLKQYAEERA